MRLIGFSTGAIARGDFRAALNCLQHESTPVVELSALRLHELDPLLVALPSLRLDEYSYVSVHAPSNFAESEEERLCHALDTRVPLRMPIIVHPDTIVEPERWTRFENRLVIENMDRRKNAGRTAIEMEWCFRSLPKARFCFDVGHARQIDPSMTEAYLLLRTFRDRLCQVHLSEVSSEGAHNRLSYSSIRSFREIAGMIPPEVPIILESVISMSEVQPELDRAREVFDLQADKLVCA